MGVPGIDELGVALLEGLVVFADLGKFEKPVENPGLHRFRLLALLRLLPVEFRPVQPARIAVLSSVLGVVIVIHHPNFVP